NVDRFAADARLQRAHRCALHERGVPLGACRRGLRAHAQRRGAVPGRSHHRELVTPNVGTPDPNGIIVVGARHTPFSDVYHHLLRAPWWLDLLGVSGLFLLLNLLFALGYVSVGGVAGARPGSLGDHFFFSVQTMGTIGYGVMHPLSAAAEALVTAEVIVGVSLVALSSGILFAKFSVPRARMQFAESATISPFDGVPTLMFRLGHEQIRWGARHADMLSERPDGRLQLDMREFHRLVPTSPTPAFPYPR